MIITDSGIIIRIDVNQVSTTGRVAQGVRLIKLKDDQKVSSVALLDKEETEDLQENSENKDTEKEK